MSPSPISALLHAIDAGNTEYERLGAATAAHKLVVQYRALVETLDLRAYTPEGGDGELLEQVHANIDGVDVMVYGCGEGRKVAIDCPRDEEDHQRFPLTVEVGADEALSRAVVLTGKQRAAMASVVNDAYAYRVGEGNPNDQDDPNIWDADREGIAAAVEVAALFGLTITG